MLQTLLMSLGESRAPSSKGSSSCWKAADATASHTPIKFPPFTQITEGTAKLQVQFCKPWLAGRAGASPAAQPRWQNTTGAVLGGSPHCSQSPALKCTSSCTKSLRSAAKGALQAPDGTAKAQSGMEQCFSSKNKLEGKEGSKIQVKDSMGVIRIAQTVPLLTCLALDNWVSFWHRVRLSKEKSQTLP